MVARVAADGSIETTTASGVAISAPAQTFEQLAELRISEALIAPPSLVAADLVMPTIRIEAVAQPSRPIVVSFPVPAAYSSGTSQLFGILWNEDGTLAEPVPVIVENGRGTAILPHLSQFSVFGLVGLGASWARDWVARQFGSFFGAAVSCVGGTSGGLLTLAQFDGRAVIDVATSSDSSTPTRARLQICNQRNQTWFTYALAPTPLTGLLSPRTTLPIEYDLRQLRDGTSVRVTATFTPEAALMTDLQLLASMLPGLGGVRIDPQVLDLLRALGLGQCVASGVAARNLQSVVDCILTPERVTAGARILVDLAVKQGLMSSGASAALAWLAPWLTFVLAAAPGLRIATEFGLIFDGGNVTFTFHQPKITVTGRTVDLTDGTAIGLLTVSAFDIGARGCPDYRLGERAPLVSGFQTDADGSFMLRLPPGRYRLSVSVPVNMSYMAGYYSPDYSCERATPVVVESAPVSGLVLKVRRK